MKFSSLVFLFFISYSLNAQLVTKVQWTKQTSMSLSDVIYYNSENKLVWGDFRGTPVEGGRTAAITMSGFGYTAGMRSSGQKGQLDIQVYCFFNKNRSWVKPGRNTAYILTHEQHHFDISYIAANIFIDKIQSEALTNENYNALLPRIYNECITIMNKMQDDYDSQTNNGQEKDRQEKWNRFIDDKITIITK